MCDLRLGITVVSLEWTSANRPFHDKAIFSQLDCLITFCIQSYLTWIRHSQRTAVRPSWTLIAKIPRAACGPDLSPIALPFCGAVTLFSFLARKITENEAKLLALPSKIILAFRPHLFINLLY